jgi:hypothetical protein
VNAAKNILRCGLTALAEGTLTSWHGTDPTPPNAYILSRAGAWRHAKGASYGGLSLATGRAVARRSQSSKMAYGGLCAGALIAGLIGTSAGAELQPSNQPRELNCCPAQHHLHGYL